MPISRYKMPFIMAIFVGTPYPPRHLHTQVAVTFLEWKFQPEIYLRI